MRKPNVLIFLTDDQAYGDLSKTGNRNLCTPVIDALEQQGAKMDNFYTCPLCAPSRAELLTGRQYIKTGVYGVTRKAEYIDLDETTIGNVFHDAGYRTACFGKWHSGSLYPYHPNARGFDEFYGFCCGHWGYYFNTQMDHNGTEVRGDGYIIDDVTNHAIDYIRQNTDAPFLCYVAYNTPHSPYQVPDRFFDRFRDVSLVSRSDTPESENDEQVKTVMAMCENIDWNMGRVLDVLKQTHLEEDTIVLYLSDNGPCGGPRYNCGMKGVKGGIDEGSVRTACSFTWKNHIPAGITVSQLGSTMDILPTAASLCDISVNTQKPLDGLDLSQFLLHPDTPPVSRQVFALQGMENKDGSYRYLLSVRDQKYRYILDRNELYDIENDRCQCHDLARQQPEIANILKKSCMDFLQTYVPDRFRPRYLTIGYRELPKAYLNAQDGEPTGSITWSSIHPNCSYFIHWDRETDVIRWPVSVNLSGAYRATLIYTCKEDSAGSLITVSSSCGSCCHPIEKAFDPAPDPILDRVPRVESLTKQFAQQVIGTLPIEKGMDVITLSGKKNGVSPICDVRTLLLELL